MCSDFFELGSYYELYSSNNRNPFKEKIYSKYRQESDFRNGNTSKLYNYCNYNKEDFCIDFL